MTAAADVRRIPTKRPTPSQIKRALLAKQRYLWPLDATLYGATYTRHAHFWRVRITRPPTQIVAVYTYAVLADCFLAVLIDQRERAEKRNTACIHGYEQGGPQRFCFDAARFGWLDVTETLVTSPILVTIGETAQSPHPDA